MKPQSFSNHVRIHPLYHYVAVPVSLALIPAALVHTVLNFSLGSVILLLATIILHLTVFLSRDYAKKNQDRIIRSELRLRYYQLTRQRLEEIEDQFSVSQLLALRFASDDEFVEMLLNPDVKQKTPEQIKKQIIQWSPDWMRV